MNYRILAFATFACSSALAQAPPQRETPLPPEAQTPSIQGSASSEPNTSERQVGGLPVVGTMGAGPEPVYGFAPRGAEPTTRVEVVPFGTSLDPGTANGGPN